MNTATITIIILLSESKLKILIVVKMMRNIIGLTIIAFSRQESKLKILMVVEIIMENIIMQRRIRFKANIIINNH
jgi:hypothetical protein